MLRSADLIQTFVAGMSFAQYAHDAMCSAAVEHHLQIVTEAAYRLGKYADIVCPGPDWAKWRGLGNLLRHAYHRVEDAIIWDTVQFDLPRLQADVLKSLHSDELGDT